MKPTKSESGQPWTIAISLREVGQLFNTMDPSPFHEKDLDADAEKFLVSWAQEFPAAAELTLAIHVQDAPGEHEHAEVEHAVQHYFAYAARLQRREFRRLMREGRHSLVIGLGFLATCILLGELLAGFSGNHFVEVLRESLTIGGWVAMWRPMQIYLYDWWPVRRLLRTYAKMGRMKVELRVRKPPHAGPRPVPVDEYMNI